MFPPLHLPANASQPFTDYSRWRLRVSEGGRHTWHYLRDEQQCIEWPQTALDKYWLGLATDLPESGFATDSFSAAKKGYEFYKNLQANDGHWPGEYGGTLFMLPAIVIGSFICGMDFTTEERSELCRYLINLANHEDGGWGLHVAGESTVFGTTLNYVSLRILGLPAEHPTCIKARELLHRLGGATGVPVWGKFWLSLLNAYDWEGVNTPIPELLLMPHWLPFHASRWWNDLILALREEIYPENYYSINWPSQRNNIAQVDTFAPHLMVYSFISDAMIVYERCALTPIRQAAISQVYRLIVAEDENTVYQGIAPLSKMFNAIARLHREGPDSDAYKLHESTRADFMWQGPEGMRVCGTNGSQLWDVVFIAQALTETGLAGLEENKDSSLNIWMPSTGSTKGAWGFSTKAQEYTVSDCTAEALKSVLYLQHLDYTPKLVSAERLYWAIDILLSLQNSSGGFASYELIRAPQWIETLNPAEVFDNTLVDCCHTECTTSVVTALSVLRKDYPNYRRADIQRAIKKGIAYIRSSQTNEGGWYGTWGICFSYATMFVLECLSLVGENYNNSMSVKRACDYLVSKQQLADGSWKQEAIEGVFNKTCSIAYPNFKFSFSIWMLEKAHHYLTNLVVQQAEEKL
ncbi:lanosterol synthase [Moniliophthora roreri MCA 2997]|uniref:Terpene cyclase/mutase family member n=1 Tax=Moniliophthora roreri (strain MCA 2997) TaxID=1381753 RepID=V2XEU7_MONRO|nr:lanosterol synthase [Moniliophthora roreri MCA 2997]